MAVFGHSGIGGRQSAPSHLRSRAQANSEEDTTATGCTADTVIKHRCTHGTVIPFRLCFCYFCPCPICGYSSIVRTRAIVGSSRRACHGTILPYLHKNFVNAYAIRASWAQKYCPNHDAIDCFLFASLTADISEDCLQSAQLDLRHCSKRNESARCHGPTTIPAPDIPLFILCSGGTCLGTEPCSAIEGSHCQELTRGVRGGVARRWHSQARTRNGLISSVSLPL